MFLKNMKIGTRLGFGFGVIFLVITGSLIVTGIQLKTVQNYSAEVAAESMPFALLAENMSFQTLEVLKILLYASTTLNPEGFKEAEKVASEFRKNINRFKYLYEEKGDIKALEKLDDLNILFDQYYEHGKDMAYVYFTEGAEEGNKLVEAFDTAAGRLTKSMNELREQEVLKTKSSVQSVISSAKRVKTILFYMSGFVIIFGILTAIIITQSIIVHLGKAISISERIAKGDLSERMNSKSTDEIGILANGLDLMADNLEGRAAIAKSIASGDLSQEVEVLSDKDTLGQSFVTMIDSLNVKAKAAEEISQGNMAVKIDVISDQDRFGKSFQAMADSLKNVVDQAGIIAKGDFSKEIIPRSKNDELGHALQKMTLSLRQMTETRQRDDWIKTGQNSLNEQMGGDLDIATISSNIIIFLAKYLDARIGTLYLMDEDAGILTLAGSYAFNKSNELNRTIEMGQGLVGQAAYGKEMITVTDIPEDYIRISSSIGDATPLNIVVKPVVYEDNLIGVIELGAFLEFSDEKLAFIDTAVENIGIGIITAQARETTRRLLNQTQIQSEELKQHHEVLEKSNEELEEQAVLLKDNEEELKSQQEELRASNEELEEKSKFLEEQADQINEKNADLESVRLHLEQQAKELQVASKYKSEFLANMSHELRTPLNSLLILSQDLADNGGGNLDDDQVESAAIINTSGHELLTLINDILDLSKIESGKMSVNIETVNLNDVADNMMRQFKLLLAKKDLEFKVNLSADLDPFVQTDQQRVEQIMKNLLSNASKFTERGGITVDFTSAQPDADLSRSGLSYKNVVAISVVDTGVGVPDDKKIEIFEAFQQADGTTSRRYGGTGLGLTISREFAKLLGGELQLQSEVGKGSTFTLYLPVGKIETSTSKEAKKQRKVAMTADFPESIPGIPAASSISDDRGHITADDKTILVIEDDLNFAKILVEQCHNKGFTCLSAASGEEGLELAEKYLPEAIMLDIRLPGIDGWTVLDKLKDNPKIRHIPVHMMSGSEVNFDAFKMGALSFLEKPMTLEQLEIAFTRIEDFSREKVKKLLVVEDNPGMRKSIKKLIGNGDVEVVTAESGKSAIKALKSGWFDCMVLDIGLVDMSGIELLGQLEKEKDFVIPPVIIYTGKDLSEEEVDQLQRYSESIIIKGVRSEDRLLDETALFLHRIVDNLPKAKKQIITNLYTTDTAFTDRKILVVDDDMRNVFALTKKFKEKGINVLKAENGLKALEILEQQPDIDLVLMDIMMPIMDGYEATAKIRAQERFAGLPIIALTAKAMKDDRDKSIAAGASDYMAKPVDLERLYSMMRVWLYKAPLF